MLNKKFMGIVACVVTFASLTMLAGTLACAEEKRPKAPSLPVCPTCKSEATTHIRGKVTAPVVMNCPDCKKETTEFGVYHCSKCEKEFMKCIKCLMPSKAATKCPKCKKILARYVKGKIESPAQFKWEMECPDCRKKPEAWLLQHCDKCEIDFLGCPLCMKE